MKGKHFLITGHTGFKGAWLAALLGQTGATVSGIALNPAPNSIFIKAGIQEFLDHDIRQDIRDADQTRKFIQAISPDVVFHLAAQPLVLSSYDTPKETFETNVNGTLNVLEAISSVSTIQATVIVTTDKVYQQNEGKVAFSENDPLGAADPYSTSKAMADLLTQSWIKSNPHLSIGIARAGNVIGGGDVAVNRLIPDLIRAFGSNVVAQVRNPSAVRPWQHVLDCLNGYIRLAEYLVSGSDKSSAFNFGPDSESPLEVSEVANLAALSWGESASWKATSEPQPTEAAFLTLDSFKAKTVLGWSDKLPTSDSIGWTVEWEKRVARGESAWDVTSEQILRFLQK